LNSTLPLYSSLLLVCWFLFVLLFSFLFRTQFQIVTEYQDDQAHLLIEACERMSHHLTAAVVSNDPQFVNEILGNTVNGTTYTGIRGRTTGAPQNHWFGPTGDPRAAGIGTADAIRLVWSTHREVIFDQGPVPSGWTQPPPS
jgi:1-pyrroline-5-carboxylate dehydrogenase